MRHFIEAHPVCYFCANAPTETEDHVPSRECFRDRVWPEGYVFPACKRCNHASSQLEQVIALYLIISNYDDADPSRDQFVRLIKGVRNNNPELLPRIDLGANAARRHFRERGMQLAPGMTYAEVPIAEFPAGNRGAFEVFARRLTCALFYKEVGRPLPLDWSIVTGWTPWGDPKSHDVAARAKDLFPDLRLTNRRNTNIGDQFSYLWGYHPDGNLFGFAAQFSKSYFFLGAAVAPELYVEAPNWKLHSADI